MKKLPVILLVVASIWSCSGTSDSLIMIGNHSGRNIEITLLDVSNDTVFSSTELHGHMITPDTSFVCKRGSKLNLFVDGILLEDNIKIEKRNVCLFIYNEDEILHVSIEQKNKEFMFN